ncbi:MAG: glycosyltransferase [Planctomycetes bacterium]|nr:glycosyltransferase [Planctomycetota bacterium]
MKLLHVIFSSVVKPQDRFLGTTKDVRGHTQYLRERGIEHEELVLPVRKERCFREALEKLDPSRFDVVLTEGTYYPSVVRDLKRRHPRLRILMRGINAELLHWLHSAHAALRFDNLRRVLFDLYGAAAFGLADLRCGWHADCVLSICEWEARRYWRWATTRARVVNVPYFLPDEYLRDIPQVHEKVPRLVCMMTTKADRPFLVDAARSLYRLVGALDGGEPEWSFSITGDFKGERLPPCPRVKVEGFLENPLELLAASRAVALLSDYGFGFKTKLLEALACGCRLLVTRKLFSRLPPPVQRYSIVVDPRSVGSFREALARCKSPFPQGDPNRELRQEAYAALDGLLGAQAPASEGAQAARLDAARG